MRRLTAGQRDLGGHAAPAVAGWHPAGGLGGDHRLLQGDRLPGLCRGQRALDALHQPQAVDPLGVGDLGGQGQQRIDPAGQAGCGQGGLLHEPNVYGH